MSATPDRIEAQLTARQWSERSGVPYRAILAAIKRGDLEAWRPTPGGYFYVSQSAWDAWREAARFVPEQAPTRSRPKVPAAVGSRHPPATGSVESLRRIREQREAARP